VQQLFKLVSASEQGDHFCDQGGLVSEKERGEEKRHEQLQRTNADDRISGWSQRLQSRVFRGSTMGLTALRPLAFLSASVPLNISEKSRAQLMTKNGISA
jgi:hypothetical protein